MAFKHYSMNRFKSVGESFFDERKQAAWAKSMQIGRDGNVEMWFGKKHTIVHTKAGPMLQVDRACTVMLAPVTETIGKPSGM